MEKNDRKKTHTSAGGVVLTEDNCTLYIALIKKKSGEWVVPKGHIEHKESAKEAAHREVMEELGLNEELYFLGPIGTTRYSFQLKDGSAIHTKTVRMYCFVTPFKISILPNKKEGYVQARWFTFEEALNSITYPTDRQRIITAKKLLLCEKRKKEKLLATIVKLVKRKLGVNLTAIILAGSFSTFTYRSHWSDIDILLVIRKIGLRAKRYTALVKKILEKRYQMHFGINIISQKEACRPSLPHLSLDGKTLQAFLEMSVDRGRMLFSRIPFRNYYIPTRRVVKKYSLLNISLMRLIHRRNITKEQFTTTSTYKKAVAKSMHIAFIILKLTMQYFYGKKYTNIHNTIRNAQKLFPSIDFNVPQKNLFFTKTWKGVNNKQTLRKIYQDTDHFIEELSDYVFKKAN